MSRGVLEPSYRRRVGYQAGLLGGMAMFASATLVMGNLHTRDDIAARQAEDLKASLSQVVPEKLHDNDLLADTIDVGKDKTVVYRGRSGGQVSAVAYQITGQGYGGEILIIMGVNRDGGILGVRVLSHSETPGLGDKIEEKRSDWILSFNGHSLDNTTATQWHVKKDGGEFDQFTGATITPRGVVKAVYSGLEFFREHRAEILTTPKDAGSDQAQPSKG